MTTEIALLTGAVLAARLPPFLTSATPAEFSTLRKPLNEKP